MSSEPVAHQGPLKVASIICLPLVIQAPDQMSPSPRDLSWASQKYQHHPKKKNNPASSSLSLSHHLVCITCHPHWVTRHGRQGLCLTGCYFPKYLNQHWAHSVYLIIMYWMDEWKQFLEVSPNSLASSPEANIYITGVKAC